MTSVAVVGGGITGLAAAWEALRAGAHVTVFEAADRLGGRIRTEEVAGHMVDLGADAFLARVPHATELCLELGLEEEVVHPSAEGAYVWARGRLRPLPPGLVLGAPAGLGDLAALVRSRLVTPTGAGRAAVDLVLPATRWGPDPSVGRVVAGRLGRQVNARLVDPLVGGIHAGRTDLLSAQAVAPQLLEAARSRSLMRGLRRMRAEGARSLGEVGRARAAAPPLFASLRGGLGRLVGSLHQQLGARGSRIELATSIEAAPVAGFDATVLATPAAVTADLVELACPIAAGELRAIEHASVTLVVLVYRASAMGRPLDGSGFLVPREEGRLLTACSFASAKWPHWAGPGDVVLRASAGAWGDERALSLDDDALVARVHSELAEALGIAGDPQVTRVARWVRAFPQYRPGHLQRVARVEAALARDLPGVIVAGAAYRGVGIAACVAQGRAAGRRAASGGGPAAD